MIATVDPNFLGPVAKQEAGRHLLHFSIRPGNEREDWGQVRDEADVAFTTWLEPYPARPSPASPSEPK